MPTVSQHYGHHAASWADDKALATRQTAAPVVLLSLIHISEPTRP